MPIHSGAIYFDTRIIFIIGSFSLFLKTIVMDMRFPIPLFTAKCHGTVPHGDTSLYLLRVMWYCGHMSETLITCDNVSFGYDGVPVIRGLHFRVEAGDYLCIVGENGSGKSTLVKGLLRLLNPLEGAVSFGGGIKQNEIGYLSQQAAAKKDFPASVYEIVLSGNVGNMGARPFYTKKEKAGAEEHLELLGITGLRNRAFRELSGGEQRRTLLARALCAHRKLLVLDEPAAGLDPLVTDTVYALLQKINRERGIPIIMVSHDMKAAAVYASHILHVMHKQLFFGNSESFMQSEAGKQFFKTAEGGVSAAP
jgi:zinc transport system ATP-binding protein